jgi:hypothetical protein
MRATVPVAKTSEKRSAPVRSARSRPMRESASSLRPFSRQRLRRYTPVYEEKKTTPIQVVPGERLADEARRGGAGEPERGTPKPP